MEVQAALTLSIGQLRQPVITAYELGVLLFQLYQTKQYKGERLKRLQRETPERSTYRRLLQDLLSAGILQESTKIRHADIYLLLGGEQASAEEAACSIDPFAYLSHMSAMEWHGLTGRIPKILFISSPAPAQWRAFAQTRMEKDLGGAEALARYRDEGLPPLRKLKPAKIFRKTVNRYASLHLGAFVRVQNSLLRVSSIGRTFLDMLREPDLCGGIDHVLDAYEAHAAHYLPLIVDEIDQHGKGIDKARAGYAIEERCGLSHPRLDAWQQSIQRGGSRKLVAHMPYSHTYSERWGLSINLDA